MTTTPDFRALCAELVDEIEGWIAYGDEADCADAHAVVDRARAALATPPPEPPASCITLHAPPAPEEVIRIDKEGFHYKGQFVADAGEAHRLMVAFLKQSNKVEPAPPTDEEILALEEKLWKEHRSINYQFEEVMNELSFGHALSAYRAVLERWGR